ncbi:ABC transporter substrate-binding protein [Glutamicibacter uratoxydans]|uniref:ABC transporter substrate-binding protein n=1 Tax=Glutamicibacter uratoxydans TaxID=43667 RepID=UPI003D6F0FED
MRYRKSLLSLLAVSSLLLASCGGAAPEEGTTTSTDSEASASLQPGVEQSALGAQSLSRGTPVAGGSLSVGLIAPIESLDPTTSVASGGSVMRAIFDSLFVYDDKGEVVPELAESLETTDEGKTWIMKLPSGVKFTDGTDFNAEAVVIHLNNLAKEGSISRAAADVRQIEKMTAVDETTIELVLQSPNMIFPKIFVWGVPGGPSLIPSPTAVKELGDKFATAPVGVGPFKVKSFQSGGNIVLERNPDYRIGGQPLLDELVFVSATDSQSRLSAAIAGDIDMGLTQSGTDLREAANGGLVALGQPDATYYNLLFNLTKEPFDDPGFRQAVIQAIDLDGLNDAVFNGTHATMDGMFPKSNPFYEDTNWPAFDPEAAKALVEEYKAGGGTPSFSLTTTSPPEFQKQAAVMQQMLGDVGIDVTINVSDQPTMVTEALSGNYQAQHRFTEVREEVDQSLRNLYHSKSTGNNGKAGTPEIDAIFDELKTAEGQVNREQLYSDLQKELTEWMPIAPLLAHKNGWYVGEDVGGFPGARIGIADPDWRLLWAVDGGK